MVRRLPLALALGLLVASCALTAPVAPPGTIPIRFSVSNDRPQPVALGVSIENRPLPGSAQPASIGPGGRADVTFFVPMARRDWLITVNGEGYVDRDAGADGTKHLQMQIHPDGVSWCIDPC
jgi:hypothetical protein